MSVKLLYFILILMFQQSINIGINFTPLVSISDSAFVNEEVKIKLIPGLDYSDVTWIADNKIVYTPENLIIEFDSPGIYILHIKDKPQPHYKIKITERTVN